MGVLQFMIYTLRQPFRQPHSGPLIVMIMMMTLTRFLLAPVHLVVKEDKTDDFSHLKWNGYIWGRGGGTLLDF